MEGGFVHEIRFSHRTMPLLNHIDVTPCFFNATFKTNPFQCIMVSLEVFKRSPQPLKAGIVATAVSRRFLEFSMYRQRCISAGSVATRSACDLFRPATSPYLSPCTLAKPKESNNR